MKIDSPLRVKSYEFAKEIVFLYVKLTESKREYVMSKQVLKSGTSIGANIEEAQYAQSKQDFISKFSIALKEASETKFWLRLLAETGFLDPVKAKELMQKLEELIALLTASIITAKKTIMVA